MIAECFRLLYTFFEVGLVGFGGGYAMLSMIMTESRRFSITVEQFADLTALDMVVPGPIAINSATYVGYLAAGFWGATAATIGVSLPSIIIVWLVMRFLDRYRENKIMNSFIDGVKPAAVGLITASAITIALGVLLDSDAGISALFSGFPIDMTIFPFSVFVIAAVCNIRFNINPILLTALAGVAGAIWAG